MKMTTKLLKSSKTLHFGAPGESYSISVAGECRAKIAPVISRADAAFGVGGSGRFGQSPWFEPKTADIWPMRCFKTCDLESSASVPKPQTERRKWPRLPLAIPVFVRSRDQEGKEFLEFATALNVSAGGMLVAIRRTIPLVSQVQLEIPSAPVAAVAMLPRASRDLRAKALRTIPAEGCYLLGMKFTRPLLRPIHSNGIGRRRKEPAPV